MAIKWVCGQIGAREHYAVPNVLQQQGKLAGLVTDWYAPRFSILRRTGGLGRAALAARSEVIPDGLVKAFRWRSLLWKRRVRQLAAQGKMYEAYQQTDSAFAAAMAKLKLPAHQIFFGYSYASLEMLVAEKKRGVLTILDQIDPGAFEFKLVADEAERFREFVGEPMKFPMAYYDRNRREWEAADRIVVNSGFSREALIKQGVDPKKLMVIPLCYQAKPKSMDTEDSRPGEALRVLFFGQVILRKGIQYLMEAARKMESENIHFDVVGPIGISSAAVASAPKNITFHGRVTRDQADEWYRQADMFVLPTLSDGFAITQLEAMSHGVPVIATACCGEVVSEGVDGFIVPPRDADALVQVFRKYLADRELLERQRPAALQKAGKFTLEQLAQNLHNLEVELLGK